MTFELLLKIAHISTPSYSKWSLSYLPLAQTSSSSCGLWFSEWRFSSFSSLRQKPGYCLHFPLILSPGISVITNSYMYISNLSTSLMGTSNLHVQIGTFGLYHQPPNVLLSSSSSSYSTKVSLAEKNLEIFFDFFLFHI